MFQAGVTGRRLIFQHFERVCVAFSGGKDSSVTLYLALEVARELKRGPVDALFIDLEGQYQATVMHVEEMFGRADIRPWWVCLPINLRNASSLEEPYWCAWEPGREADWIRPMPIHPSVISDLGFFPFYRYRMEFEEFVPEFNEWLAQDVPTAFLVGIRSEESLNRYRAVKSRARIKKRAWTPPGGQTPIQWSARDRPDSRAVSFFPIDDWRFQDLWRYTGEHHLAYNRLYDHMYRAGLPLRIRKRLHGYLPVVGIRSERTDTENRIASTIRHNRARGVHGVLPMMDIVVALLKAGWNEAEVARELGMDNDEVLRFKQVSGLPELFRDHDYSKSWD